MKMENLVLYHGAEFNANFFYHTGLDIDHSFYLKLGKKETLVVPKLNERAAKLVFKGKVLVYKKPSEDVLKLVLGKKVGLDYSNLPARMYERLNWGAKIEDASDALLELRAMKKDAEIANIKKAVNLTRKLFSELESSLEKFKTEMDVRNWLYSRTYELGLEPAFEPIVGSGINSALPHSHSSASKIRNFVLVDYGVRYNHYCADLTRVFFLKKEPKIIQAYEKTESIFNEIVDNFPQFENGKDLAVFAEKQFKRHHLPKSIHSIGHGVGLDVHEFPRLNRKYSDGLKGTVMAIEPGAYFRNFGVRFEHVVHFDGKKARIL
ncbi:MAG: M24 family metallopeptidase [Candidatus ainarchaeum sp.]|nr:M24 family metallopeptidase [Candidatus ainarchaeum sp.]